MQIARYAVLSVAAVLYVDVRRPPQLTLKLKKLIRDNEYTVSTWEICENESAWRYKYPCYSYYTKIKFTFCRMLLQLDYYTPLLLKSVIHRRGTARIKYFWKCSLSWEWGKRNTQWEVVTELISIINIQ